MFKEGHGRTKSVFQNYHLRIRGVNPKAETPISRGYYCPGQKWWPRKRPVVVEGDTLVVCRVDGGKRVFRKENEQAVPGDREDEKREESRSLVPLTDIRQTKRRCRFRAVMNLALQGFLRDI